MVTRTGLVYSAKDVSRILGLPCKKISLRTPSPRKDELVLYYGGWSLTDLRNSPAGQERMWQDQDWYDENNFSAEPGYYAVQLRVPDSNRKDWQEQQALLGKAEESCQPAPVAVAATALLLQLKQAGNDLLQNDWCRCMEESAQGSRVVLTVNEGRVYVYNFWDDHRHAGLWLAAARKF